MTRTPQSRPTSAYADLRAFASAGGPPPPATGALDAPPFDRDALIRALQANQAGMSTFAELFGAREVT